MIVLHLALGGCLRAPPVKFGITADTGGHIAYVLDAACHQSYLPEIDQVVIATRLFESDRLGAIHSEPQEIVSPKVVIQRIASAELRYLEKEALAADLIAFTDAFCAWIASMPCCPDVIHAHFADAAAVATVAQRQFGIPFVYTPHALGIDKRAQGIASPGLDGRIEAERAAIAAASAIVVSTRDEASRQIGGYGVPLSARVRVIPPGVPRRDLAVGTSTLADRLNEWLDSPALPIILAIARPVLKKNLATLLIAFADDAALRGAANLIILAGQHDYAAPHERAVLNELQTLVTDLKLCGQVALPPRHSVDDVAALYALAAQNGVFVNPALHEPFGLTLIEAAAAGLPVVATRNGGPSEIVETIGHGLLVDPGNPAEIGAAMRAIITDDARRSVFAAAAKAGAAHYCWRRYAADTVELYREIATPRLLVCDIDNTLTGSADAAAAFASWRTRSGLPFVVATGRSFDNARAEMRRWRLPQPDAYIVDVGTRMMLADGRGGWRACNKFAHQLDVGWDRAAVVVALAPLRITPQPDATGGPHKISFYGTGGDAARIRAVLVRAELPARVVFSHGRLIDVLAPAGGKAAAIAAYAARYGWTLADCIAAGDSGNDADMLAACGHAIIVGNASDDLADLPDRPGLYRATAPHAAGVLEGLADMGLGGSIVDTPAPTSLAMAAA